MPTCKRCTKVFSNTFKIDGFRKSLSKRKYCLDCSPYKQHNTKKLGADIFHIPHRTEGMKFCSLCSIEKKLSEFYKNGKHSYCIPCSKKDSIRRLKKLKTLAIEYKGGKCIKCGYDKSVGLDFHHRDRVKKLFTISTKLNGSFNDLFKAELDKCDLLCCRCHREIEAEISENNSF